MEKLQFHWSRNSTVWNEMVKNNTKRQFLAHPQEIDSQTTCVTLDRHKGGQGEEKKAWKLRSQEEGKRESHLSPFLWALSSVDSLFTRGDGPSEASPVSRNDEDFSYAPAFFFHSRPSSAFFLLFLSKLKKPLHFVTLFRQNAVTRSWLLRTITFCSFCPPSCFYSSACLFLSPPLCTHSYS